MSDQPLSDWELWAIATYLEEHLGDETPYFITGRMLTLAEQDDEAGVYNWQGISDRYDKLRAEHRGPHSTLAQQLTDRTD